VVKKFKKTNGGKQTMVDITEATESPFLTTDLIEESQTKTGVIVDGGSYEKGEFGRKLVMKIQFDKKMKTWTPNRESSKNMQSAWGNDTDTYVGKSVLFSVVEAQNKKKSVIATPIKQPEVTTEPAEPIMVA
jgi:hypothetical protein